MFNTTTGGVYDFKYQLYKFIFYSNSAGAQIRELYSATKICDFMVTMESIER